MSLLARFLMLLACGPLLQPPGLCVCRAGDGVGTPQTERHVDCCSHQNCTDDDTDSGESTPAPRPEHDDHAPGCPASAGVDRFKWVEPATPPVADFPPAVVAVLPFTIATSHTSVPPPIVCRPVNAPLYLSHCALVI